MRARRGARDRKSIFDPVHGLIALEDAPLELIGHPAFQRLWGIRQTGFAHLVFPGANHTRLEHSLGVYFVAGRMAEALGLEPADRATVTAGALLHDLGHGPFSHTLEPTLREVTGHGHERVSRAWILGERLGEFGDPGRAPPAIPDVLERHHLDPRRIADLVDPPPGRERRPLLRAVLHGAIDADRLDYLQRDAHYTGVAHGAIDAVRILETARALDGRLVFAEKGRNALEGFLVGRALMYASVYYHKTVRAAEVMAQAAVERLPGFPDAVPPLLEGTDGELLVALARSGSPTRGLVRGLLERRLYKRAHAYRDLDASARRELGRLARDPPVRRAREEELAEAARAPPASVLIDLSGLELRERSELDWSEVALLEEGRTVHPFRPPSPWREFALRPPSPWAASVYVHPRYRAAVERRLARSPGGLP